MTPVRSMSADICSDNRLLKRNANLHMHPVTTTGCDYMNSVSSVDIATTTPYTDGKALHGQSHGHCWRKILRNYHDGTHE